MAYNTPARPYIENIHLGEPQVYTVTFDGTAVSLTIINDGPGDVSLRFDDSDGYLYLPDGQQWQSEAHAIHYQSVAFDFTASGDTHTYITLIAGVVKN